jgi:hypothetical protein
MAYQEKASMITLKKYRTHSISIWKSNVTGFVICIDEEEYPLINQNKVAYFHTVQESLKEGKRYVNKIRNKQIYEKVRSIFTTIHTNTISCISGFSASIVANEPSLRHYL